MDSKRVARAPQIHGKGKGKAKPKTKVKNGMETMTTVIARMMGKL